MADKISFFQSYHKAFKNLPPEVVGEVVQAMGAYAFEGEEVELDGIAASIYELIKPVMESSLKKASNGKKGGETESKPKANAKQTESKREANLKQTESKVEAIRNRNKDIGIGVGEGIGEGEEEKESATHSPKRSARFVPPTLEEIKDYCTERNSTVDPAKFFEYFDKGNWIDSKGNKVKNWKQKIITWENMGHGDNRASPQNVKPFNPTEYLLQQIREEEANSG